MLTIDGFMRYNKGLGSSPSAFTPITLGTIDNPTIFNLGDPSTSRDDEWLLVFFTYTNTTGTTTWVGDLKPTRSFGVVNGGGIRRMSPGETYSGYVDFSFRAGAKEDGGTITVYANDERTVISQTSFSGWYASIDNNTPTYSYDFGKPTGISLDETAILVKSRARTTVGYLYASDPDENEGDTHTFELLSGSSPGFIIEGNELKTVQSFPREGIYPIYIRTTDSTGNTFDKAFDIRAVKLDFFGGSGNDFITGNEFGNKIVGNAGNDRLIGDYGADILVGNAGTDTLVGDTSVGGSGQDQFVFDMNARFNARTMGVDVITDFVPGTDQIVLDRTTFTKLRGSTLKPPEFASVKTLQQAQKSGALITYIRSKGSLFYNENGAESGFGAGGQFADLKNGLPLSRSNISIVT